MILTAAANLEPGDYFGWQGREYTARRIRTECNERGNALQTIVTTDAGTLVIPSAATLYIA